MTHIILLSLICFALAFAPEITYQQAAKNPYRAEKEIYSWGFTSIRDLKLSWNAVLSGFLRWNRFQDAHRVFEYMFPQGFVDSGTYALLIEYALEKNNIPWAIELMEEMKIIDNRPSYWVSAYDILIHGMADKAKWAEVFCCLMDMKENGLNTRPIVQSLKLEFFSKDHQLRAEEGTLSEAEVFQAELETFGLS